MENEETKPIGLVVVHEHEPKHAKRNRTVECMSIRHSLFHHLMVIQWG